MSYSPAFEIETVNSYRCNYGRTFPFKTKDGKLVYVTILFLQFGALNNVKGILFRPPVDCDIVKDCSAVEKSTMSSGAIAAIVIGSIVLLLVLALIGYMIYRKRINNN